LYGPTDTTVWSTCRRVESVSGPIPIGRPIDNTRVYVLDRSRELVPPGATGELYIGGAGVALGYLNRPELTAERFLADPLSSEPEARMYRTGDAVRFRHDGSLEYLERLDQQVKVRGYRIELGEIEAALAAHTDVARAAVVVREDRPGDKRLVGYVVVKPQRSIDTAELRDHLKKRLPEYMVVAHVVELDELPLTANGKVDKKRLPAPSDVATDRRPAVLQPRTVTERHIAAVWSSVLGVSEVGADDNFFDVGGHSLLAVRLSVELSRAFGIEVSLGQILTGPTIAEIARVVDAGGGPERVAIVPLRRGTLSPPLFCICGINLYHELAKSLGPDLSVYGIFVPAEASFLQADRTQTDEGRQALPTVQELAAAYVEAIRSKQPCGPYRLAGLCFGGLLAYEAARQLEAAGEQVDLLALLEIVLPSAMHWRPARWVAAHLKGFRHEGLGYVTRRLEPRWAAARARLLGALGAAEPHAPPAADEVVANDARLADIRNEAYQHAMRLYDQTPKRYGGNVVIFRAIDEPFFAGYAVEPDGGFSRLVSGKVDVHHVPGDHLGILAHPHVTKLTTVLGRYVEGAALSALVAPPVEA
jgi:thioesterase domain-containing protein/acyl carrier protein